MCYNCHISYRSMNQRYATSYKRTSKPVESTLLVESVSSIGFNVVKGHINSPHYIPVSFELKCFKMFF